MREVIARDLSTTLTLDQKSGDDAKFLEPELLQTFQKNGEEFDADPYTGTQEPTSLRLKNITENCPISNICIVTADFSADVGAGEHISYEVVLGKNSWQIRNITYTDGLSAKEMFNQPTKAAENTSPKSNFEDADYVQQADGKWVMKNDTISQMPKCSHPYVESILSDVIHKQFENTLMQALAPIGKNAKITFSGVITKDAVSNREFCSASYSISQVGGPMSIGIGPQPKQDESGDYFKLSKGNVDYKVEMYDDQTGFKVTMTNFQPNN